MYGKATDILRRYRESRGESRRNVRPSKWFVSFAADGGGVEGVLDAFGADDENDGVIALDKAKTSNARHQALGIKISFLAGCRRDLRAQFAVGASRWRLPSDADRHAALEAGDAVRALDEAAFVLNRMEGGNG